MGKEKEYERIRVLLTSLLKSESKGLKRKFDMFILVMKLIKYFDVDIRKAADQE